MTSKDDQPFDRKFTAAFVIPVVAIATVFPGGEGKIWTDDGNRYIDGKPAAEIEMLKLRLQAPGIRNDGKAIDFKIAVASSTSISSIVTLNVG